VPVLLGVDLAWGEGRPGRPANETGVCALGEDGRILDAGWTVGVQATFDWIRAAAGDDAVVAIDAPLVVPNATGMRDCEREVARRYGRWKVAANASNAALGWQAGVALRRRLEAAGFGYLDRLDPVSGRVFFECYPYTTLVGMAELGYDDERPRYKRLIRGLPAPDAREERARRCDDLLRRVATLTAADPPLDLVSHPVTRRLLEEPSPVLQRAYKHREDLLDAVLCAWTAAILHRSPGRMQVLGATADPDPDGRRPVILAPARPEQRRGSERRMGP